ncbi:MAG: hypothetical protein V1709_00820 [Planctomycetota bacterium]
MANEYIYYKTRFHAGETESHETLDEALNSAANDIEFNEAYPNDIVGFWVDKFGKEKI